MALVLNDQTANGNTLTNHGTATADTADLPFATNNVNAADVVAASSQYFDALDSVSLSVTGNMTLMTWVKFATLPSSGGRMFIFAKRAGVGSRGFRFDLFNNSGTYQLELTISSDGTAETSVVVNWTPSTSTWYNVALVYTAAGGTADFYVNGSAQGTQQSGLPNSIFDNNVVFEWGAQSAANFIDGKIDDGRVYNTARTAGAIAGDYNQELHGNEAGLVAYWPLEVPSFATGGFLSIL